jgi:hypothetical protein
MIIKEWSCNLFKILSWRRFAPLLPNCSKGGHILQRLGEEAFTLISNVLGNGVALNCSHLSLLININENPTKIWKLWQGLLRPNSLNR